MPGHYRITQQFALIALEATVLGFAGVFALFTYIQPILTRVSGYADTVVSPILLVFGGGMVVGNLFGGRLGIAAFNLGNAIGAWLGGVVIRHGSGLGAVSRVAALLPVLELVVARHVRKPLFRAASVLPTSPLATIGLCLMCLVRNAQQIASEISLT